jgi:predicted Zn finger-like uncharacterized protein
MLITCPNCAASYDVPDHLLAGAVRLLRCARCAVEWDAQSYVDQAPQGRQAVHARQVQAVVAEPMSEVPDWPDHRSLPDDDAGRMPPPPDDSRLPAGISLSTDAPIRRRLPSEPPRMSALVAAWVLSLVVVGSLGWGVWHWRDDVMTIWPPSQRAFGVVGSH